MARAGRGAGGEGDGVLRWGRKKKERKKEKFLMCFGYFKMCILNFEEIFEIIVVKVIKKHIKEKLGKKTHFQRGS